MAEIAHVAVVCDATEELEAILPWAARLARARRMDILVLQVTAVDVANGGIAAVPLNPPREDDSWGTAVAQAAAREGLDAGPHGDDKLAEEVETEAAAPRSHVIMHRVSATIPVDDALAFIRDAGVDLLVIPSLDRPKGDDPVTVLERHLFRRAPSAAMMLRPPAEDTTKGRRILVPTSGGPHAREALRRAVDLGRAGDHTVVALMVQEPLGPDARPVAERTLGRIVARDLGPDASHVTTRVVLDADPWSGIRDAVDDETSLILVGASEPNPVRDILHGRLSDHLLQHSSTGVGVIRKAIPLASRLRQAVDRWLRVAVPQLDREGRLTLVERIQESSRWSFDFIALVCLSTLIAAFGLVRNSASVIIGAMLVAPLMTPLLGTGLALAQRNARLARSAMTSLGAGFCLAFVLGWLAGVLLPGITITGEMAARGAPNLVDLHIALLSGIAAAYASSRPHLSAALPGVAIAAALVPPIATSGIALSAGDIRVAVGAAVLFATNMVAIVLGSTFCLWVVGLRGRHAQGRRRPWGVAGFVFVSMLTFMTAAFLPSEREVREDVRGTVAAVIATEEGTRLVSVLHGRDDRGPVLDVAIEGPRPPPPGLADRIRERVAETTGADVRVRLSTRLVSRSGG